MEIVVRKGLTGKYADMVNFAKFVSDHRFSKAQTEDCALLCKLIRKRASFASMIMNKIDDKRDDTLCEEIKSVADNLGFIVSFPSSFAEVTDVCGQRVQLPFPSYRGE